MNIKKIFVNISVTLFLLVGCAVGAFAASSAPRLELRETGAKNQYSITFRNWSSEYYGVEFDIEINQNNLNFDMKWADGLQSSYKNIKSEQNGDKTVLKFYYTKRTPISNSNSARIGEITFANINENPNFSTSGKIILADGSAQKIEFSDLQVSLVKKSSDSSGNGFSSVMDWDDVKDKVKVENDGVKRVNISLEKNPHIYTDILQKIKDGKIIATFDYGDYQWEIDGKNIKELPADRIYYDLSIEKLALKNLSVAVDNSDILQFETSFKGTLPFSATLIYPLGSQYSGQTVYVSRYNEQNGTLSYLTNAKVDESGNMRIKLTNLNKQVVTSQNFWNVNSENADNQENPNTQSDEEENSEAIIVPGLDSEEMDEADESENSIIDVETSLQSIETPESSSTVSSDSAANNKNHIVIAVIVVAIVLACAGIIMYLNFKRNNKEQ